MMDPNFRTWDKRMNREERNFGKMLKKEEDAQEWSINKMIINIGNSSLMSSMIFLILLIRDMMLREMILKEQT